MSFPAPEPQPFAASVSTTGIEPCATDFAALSPKINSGRMYAGPGSGPMLRAAAVWDKLADGLYNTAASYSPAVSNVTGVGWLGPASISMATAAARYAGWMTATAELCQQAAIKAGAAATAYEAALAMTVPPTVIAANRAQLSSLVATKALDQNAPAIAAVEAQYDEMWAQDATAMYGYAGASAAASRLAPFAPPPTIASASGLASQPAGGGQVAGASVLRTLSLLISAAPEAQQALASPTSSTSELPQLLMGTGTTGVSSAAFPIPATVSASIGAASAGALSVPETWAEATKAVRTAALSLPGNGISASPALSAGRPAVR
jgi:PPE family/PPE-SVP subfamily C-terminal region